MTEWAEKVLEGVVRLDTDPNDYTSLIPTKNGSLVSYDEALAAIAKLGAGDGLLASIAAITCPEAEAMSDGARLTALIHYADKAAAHIAALTAQVAEKEEQLVSVLRREAATHERHDAKMEAAEAERDALRAKVARMEGALTEIAEEASVPVHTWKNGINFKKMYEGWRKIATQRIDIARAALTDGAADGGKDD